MPPPTVPQLAFPVATHVALPFIARPAGNGSLTETFSASEGPALVIVIVYVALPPGVYVPDPSLLVAASADLARRASVSEPLADAPEARSVAVAVLISGSSIMPAANATGTVNVSLLAAPVSMRAP